ncbi:MAG: hypothetical protein RR410_02875 [Alistipes sp.]
MKKNLLCVSLFALLVGALGGCSQRQEWNNEQRQAMRESLQNYRQMVYLDDLNDADFVYFTDQVAVALEEDFPVYETFVSMPGVVDSVDVMVVTTIVDQLDADARNMRHIYPYNYLVAQGTLPAGLNHDQLQAFYQCFAGKVNATFSNMEQFFNAILSNNAPTSQITQLENQCANELFDWTVTEVEVVEGVMR